MSDVKSEERLLINPLPQPIAPIERCKLKPTPPKEKEFQTTNTVFWKENANASANFKLVDCLKTLPEDVNIDDLMVVIEKSTYSDAIISIAKQTLSRNPAYDTAIQRYNTDLARYNSLFSSWEEENRVYRKAHREWEVQQAVIRLQKEKDRLEKMLLKVNEKIVVKTKPKGTKKAKVTKIKDGE